MSSFPVYSDNLNTSVSVVVAKAGVDGYTFATSASECIGKNVINTITRTGEGVYTFILTEKVYSGKRFYVSVDASRATPVVASINTTVSIATTGVATVTITNVVGSSSTATDFVENDYIKILIVRGD